MLESKVVFRLKTRRGFHCCRRGSGSLDSTETISASLMHWPVASHGLEAGVSSRPSSRRKVYGPPQGTVDAVMAVSPTVVSSSVTRGQFVGVSQDPEDGLGTPRSEDC